jgi:hypothetical protein
VSFHDIQEEERR